MNTFIIEKLKIVLLIVPLFVFLVNFDIPADDVYKVWEKSRSLIMDGKMEEGWKLYEGVLIKNPKDINVVLGAGCLRYYQAEKSLQNKSTDNIANYVKEAEQNFNTAVLLADKPELKSKALFNKGNCSLLLADFQKSNPEAIQECVTLYRNAVQCYREALEIQPNFSEAKRNLDHALYELKQLLRQSQENKQDKENEQDQKQDSEQKTATMFLNTRTEVPDAEVHVLEEQPNVVELRKRNK
ncbi:MAG TPA: hypothetical protein PLT82_02345 [Candidatus Hydrogenedens sp.]|nr:hypothetical protein [Candidatus Hydrogenedens sp.]HOL19351.1 hypothetical protein [Candidatus Hydrogenedens sp.]HPP57951.1 hypothetical protein [Candidatus Hydrogenedens sp.]